MIKIHNIGFPRIGKNRELKFALERYWRGEIPADALHAVGRELRRQHWQLQAGCGLDYLPVGDFSYYDHVLDTSVMLGAVPARFACAGDETDLDSYFRMARGRGAEGSGCRALEMTKWFDTNYHYLVPEIAADQPFRLAAGKLLGETRELLALGYQPKPVVLGPLSWLWLAKPTEAFDRLTLLPRLLPVYAQLLAELAGLGVGWVQIDEPVLALDLPADWQTAFATAYQTLACARPDILLASYFGGLGDNLQLACRLPVAGLHVDLVRAPQQLDALLAGIGGGQLLSLGLIDGRNVWRTDLPAALATLRRARAAGFAGRLWLAPSCSLLHVPLDLDRETAVPLPVRPWLAFARQKLTELELLRLAAEEGEAAAQPQWGQAAAAIASRRTAVCLRDDAVQARLAGAAAGLDRRHSPFAQRKRLQQERLDLPAFPTTTIGSLPQTPEIRKARQDYRRGRLAAADYTAFMERQIRQAVREQETLGLDVLVHGEPERNDMVEYFGEQLTGFLFTGHGWVQSYGSRCVKPPIIYADVSRPQPMTVRWSRYAQYLTDRPMKGMLTGPVTLLNWSFVRDDQPREQTACQLALAIRDEVLDLERAGIRVIQIDEPALREGLPLRHAEQPAYLAWAARAFRIAAGGVADATQIHTHMCYSEFNDIVAAIADLDADVVTIEASRSNMELLDAFAAGHYPNDIGPGVYDIHSPNLPAVAEIRDRLAAACRRLAPEQLWVNPDCGLKTREWHEVRPALAAMVAAARQLRAQQTRSGQGLA